MKITQKIVAFTLTLVLIICAIPNLTVNPKADTIKLGYIFETGVNIRKDATTSSDKVDNVSKWNVTVLGSKADTLGTKNPDTGKTFIWYKITYTTTSGTVTGYVREDLITVTEYTPDEAFKKSLEAFPESYHEALTKLHAMYPNWKFTADKVTGYSSFSKAVAAQDSEYIKLVETNYNSWRSMRNKCYDWSTGKFITTDGGRYGASTEVIAYYMDPRNFLNANDIYIYMQQSYDSTTQTLEGVQKILDGTFLSGKVTDKNDKYYGKPYAGVIRYAGSKSGVNAYVLASTIIQEHGTKGTSLSKGYSYEYDEGKTKKVYNFFNFGASGTTSAAVLKNGAKYAYNEGWLTPTESIVGGATKYGKNYIAIGQNTYFYKNYNVLNPDKIWHQYAQNVADSLSSSRSLKNTYSELYDLSLTFRIPVFDNLPTKVSALPAKSDKYNNYYFDKLSATGLSPAYNRYTNKYTLKVTDDTELFYKLPAGATYAGEATYDLVKGKNTVKLKVKSQTGYSRTYTVTVTADKVATLTVKPSGGTLKKESDGKWYYYVDGAKSTETTLVNYSGKWFYVKDGVWDKTANTLVKYASKWFYVEEGKWRDDVTTLFKYNGKWFYIENGKWNSSANILYKFNGKWFYIIGGKWDNTAETLFKFNEKWFYIKGGKWSRKTLIFTFSGKQFYVQDGKVDLTFSGTVKIDGKTYKIKNGKVV